MDLLNLLNLMVTALTLVREVEAEVMENVVISRGGGVPHPRLTCVALALAREAEPALMDLLNLMVTALTLVREVEAEVMENAVLLHISKACHQDNEGNRPAFRTVALVRSSQKMVRSSLVLELRHFELLNTLQF